jgi:hypothetical protein
MKIKLKQVSKYERLANYFRYRATNRAEVRHVVSVSKASHPSRPRPLRGTDTSMESQRNHRVGLVPQKAQSNDH